MIVIVALADTWVSFPVEASISNPDRLIVAELPEFPTAEKEIVATLPPPVGGLIIMLFILAEPVE